VEFFRRRCNRPWRKELELDGIIIPVVECCIKGGEDRKQGDAYMVWRNTEVWTSDRSWHDLMCGIIHEEFSLLEWTLATSIENRNHDFPLLPPGLHDGATTSIRSSKNSFLATFRDATLAAYSGTKLGAGRVQDICQHTQRAACNVGVFLEGDSRILWYSEDES